MSFREQKKYLEELKKLQYKIDSKDLYELKMFLKMDKDEEDFDTLSMEKLKKLYEKYSGYKSSARETAEKLFRKKNL